MEKQNRFSKNFSQKSTSELKNIIGNPKYQTDAQEAASWELENRSGFESRNEADEIKTEGIVFTTEKKETRLFLLLIFSSIALMARCSQGINIKSISSYESLFNLIGLLFSVGLIIYVIRNSFRKMSAINESFEISDNYFVLKKNQDVVKFDSENKPNSIERTLNEIVITKEGESQIKIDLENYSLSYSKSKLLTSKIDELNRNWNKAPSSARM